MNEQKIEEIKNSIRELMRLISQNGQSLSEEMKKMLAQVLDHAANRIQSLRQEVPEQAQKPQIEPEVPITPFQQTTGADLLWILAGGQEDAFVNYLRTFPDPALNSLLQNPQQLQVTIQHLQQTMPPGEQPSVEGIEKTPLNSSNIYGFKYDPKSGRLLVRFQSGSVYGYNGVPPGVFRVFQQGAIPARTEGKNKFGRWWIGKIPSLGASFYQLIRQGNYPYQRLS